MTDFLRGVHYYYRIGIEMQALFNYGHTEKLNVQMCIPHGDPSR